MLASLVTSPTLDLSSPLSRRKQSIIGSPSISAHARTSSTSAHARTSSRSVDLAANLINNNTVARAAVAQEYANLRYREHCPLGMYVTPAMDNLLVWDAVLFVHRGAFAFAFTFPFHLFLRVMFVRMGVGVLSERAVRVLYGFDIEVQVDFPDGLSGTTAHGAIHDRRLPSAHLATGRDV